MPGVTTLAGTSLPTERNALVRHHYKSLGFRLRNEQASGATLWEVDTRVEVSPPPMAVDRSGFELAAVQ